MVLPVLVVVDLLGLDLVKIFEFLCMIVARSHFWVRRKRTRQRREGEGMGENCQMKSE